MIVVTMIITLIRNHNIDEYGNFCFTETGKKKKLKKMKLTIAGSITRLETVENSWKQ